MALGLCLTGEALTVVGRMSPEDSLQYGKLKLGLLERFRYTPEGYREKFRESEPLDDDTGKQFAARLTGYLDRWLQTGKIPETFEALRDKIISEQFLRRCPTKLSVFLKERGCATLEILASSADQYFEAQGLTRWHKPKDTGQTFRSGSNVGKKTESSGSRCLLCDKTGHKATECWTKTKTSPTSVCWTCGKPGHKAGSCSKRSSDKNPQTSCMLSMHPAVVIPKENESVVLLKDGTEIPVVNAALGRAPRFLLDSMPVVEGEVDGEAIRVLRDSGCNTVVVRKSLVAPEKFTGITSPVFLLDQTVKYLPEAEIFVNSPYFTGKVTAKCMENPLYDLVLRNIEGVRNLDDPDLEWRRAEKVEPPSETVNGLVEEHEDELQTLVKEVYENGETAHHIADTAEDVEMVAALTEGKKRTAKTSQLPTAPVGATTIDRETLTEEQQKDETLQRCFRVVGRKFLSPRGHESEFVLVKGVLYRKYKMSDRDMNKQLVVPKKFRESVLSLGHEGRMAGHQGIARTTERVFEGFYWPGVHADVKRFVKSCDICQRTVPKQQVIRGPLGSMPIVDTAFQKVGIDIIGPLSPTSEQGNRYILTMVDFATRYPDAIAVPSIDTRQVAEGLLEMFSRVGLPREIVSDRGPSFTSDLMKEISRLLSVKQLLTTPYELLPIPPFSPSTMFIFIYVVPFPSP